MQTWRNLTVAVRMTIVTAALLGIIYPLIVTGLAQTLFPEKANGQLVERNGHLVGSRIIGQQFVSPRYFHGRPSAAGDGYDAAASGGSNLGPTNAGLLARVKADVAARRAENPGAGVPVDLVTASASGLDPHISPAAARFQIPRVAGARGVPQAELERLVSGMIEPRQLAVLGEPVVNVLLLNMEIDRRWP